MNEKNHTPKLTFDLFFSGFMKEYERSWNDMHGDILGYVWLDYIKVHLMDRLHISYEEFEENYKLIETNHTELFIETVIGGGHNLREYIKIIKKDDI